MCVWVTITECVPSIYCKKGLIKVGLVLTWNRSIGALYSMLCIYTASDEKDSIACYAAFNSVVQHNKSVLTA